MQSETVREVRSQSLQIRKTGVKGPVCSSVAGGCSRLASLLHHVREIMVAAKQAKTPPI